MKLIFFNTFCYSEKKNDTKHNLFVLLIIILLRKSSWQSMYLILPMRLPKLNILLIIF